ncbi:hypothetical protein CPJCM30710_03260 [Clostridium polyendosporum]|uniref:Uncharacterized protein n=1 Tax=Clostridium polyendosporum TaxID=69208 RepID=A0A919VEQ6_9CLOT|nr:DUF6143 family protein [Clostridium polyendosporum]GIM27660.1 hypothetical protein CPJCM30710_03260 [Clostridium polyendosporum]
MKENNMSPQECMVKIPNKVITIPNPVYQSYKGRYFVGQSKFLIFGVGTNAWAALVNPRSSGVNLFVNVFTVSNFSNESLTAEIWLNTIPPGISKVSRKFSPTDTALSPLPEPKVQLEYAQNVTGFPSKGINIYGRIVPSQSTLVSEEDGKFVIPPGGNYLVFLSSSGQDFVKAKIAFGWWEEKVFSI